MECINAQRALWLSPLERAARVCNEIGARAHLTGPGIRLEIRSKLLRSLGRLAGGIPSSFSAGNLNLPNLVYSFNTIGSLRSFPIIASMIVMNDIQSRTVASWLGLRVYDQEAH